MHDCASILDSIAKDYLVSTIFRMVNPIPTSPFIQLCLHLFHIFFA